MSEQGEPEVPDWGGAPEALGLSRETDGSLTGRDQHGIRVSVRRVDGPRTRLEAWLEPPLQMGLSMRVRRPDEPPEPGPLGFSTLEAAYVVELAEPEHGQRVIGPCVQALLEAAQRQPGLRVDDERVWLELEGGVNEPAAIAEALSTLAVVARWLRGSRSQELTGWEQNVQKGWPTIASTWGLGLDLGRLRMRGVVDGAQVEVWITPGALPRTALRVQVPPLGFHLSLSPADDEQLAERFVVGEPFETGEPELDALRVVGEPEEHLREILTHTTRGDLLALLERGALAISFEDDAVEMWAPGAVFRGAGIEAMIADARRAADNLREVTPDARPERGPYR